MANKANPMVAETAAAQKAERAAMVELGEIEESVATDDVSNDTSFNFNITKNRPLPEGFENPELGEYGRKCLDNGGAYDPDWVQLKIDGVYEGQANPQKFPLGGVTYAIPLDVWVDAPRCVLESLKSAVETHHTQAPPTPGEITLGVKKKRVSIERNRFVYHVIESA